MNANSLRKSGAYRMRPPPRPTVVQPQDLNELRQVFSPMSNYLPPFRPQGAGSSATDCTTATAGTVIDMTAMNTIHDINVQDFTVTVQPGVRIGALADELAEQGLELEGSHDLTNRTVGGAVAGGCIGPAIGGDGALFASQVCNVRLVTPSGAILAANEDKKNLLNALRLSYGMFGVFHEITLRVRPIQPFMVTHRRCTVSQFAEASEKLAKAQVGLKYYLLPFRDRVYVDLRRYDEGAADSARLPWRIKDWGESTVLPHVFKSLNRIVPVAGVRYRIIDEISKLTQGMVNNRLVAHGSNAATQAGAGSSGRLNYSTWLFPATDFAIVVKAYCDMCLRVHAESGFRCDMPAMGFRLSADQSALLSPSFDEPMIALRALTTQAAGWENFAIDFAEFAEHWGGVPLFNQSRSLSTDYAREIFGSRLDFFRKMRRRVDPEDRMMNPFLSQYFL